MGRASREKGKRGEREVAAIYRSAGLTAAERAGWKQSAGAAHSDVVIVEGLWTEVKRQERICMPAWIRQATQDASAASTDDAIFVPSVAFRQSHMPWWIAVPLEHHARLLAASQP